MNVKKVGVYIIMGLLISVLGITTVTALNTESGIWHSSDKISVIKQDCPLPLCLWESNWVNTPVTLNDITTLKTGISWTINLLDYKDAEPIIGGHNASQIWVAVASSIYNQYADEEMTLLQALKTGQGLCPPVNVIDRTYSGPPDKTQAYHYATEVEVTIDGVTTNLQEAINGGAFCWNYYWAIGAWSGCSVGCGTGTQTRIVYCSRNDGIEVADSLCAAAGTKPAISQSCSHQCYWYFKSEQTGGAACNWFISPNYCFPDCSGGVGCNTGVACNSYLGWYSDCWYNKYVVAGCTQRFYQCY